MKKTIAASTIFLLLLLSGGIWISLAQFLPDGVPRSVLIIVLGAVFVGTFIWLLISRVRGLLAGKGRVWVEIALVSVNLTLLILAFAWMYKMIGVMDNTPSGPQTVNDFLICVYYSVVTFTTLGYGDYYPQGIGRVLAAMEALTGYLILGILASTGASLLSPKEGPFKEENQ